MKLAAIDVGSNAIRFMLAESSFDGSLEILKTYREPIRLGRDVFKTGLISEKSGKETVKAFQKFAKILAKHKIHHVMAVATSALRDARNGSALQERIFQKAGIHVCIISGYDEAKLINHAVDQKISTRGRHGAYIDIGGGSLELSLITNQKLTATQTFKMGTVRTLQAARLEDRETSVPKVQAVIRKHIPDVTKFIRLAKIPTGKLSVLAGTGGNIEALGKLRVEALGKGSSQFITSSELEELIQLLGKMTYADRIKKLHLRADRADVIIPAAVALLTVMKLLKKHDLTIPFVGLKDGVLLELNASLNSGEPRNPCYCHATDKKRERTTQKTAQARPSRKKDELNGLR